MGQDKLMGSPVIVMTFQVRLSERTYFFKLFLFLFGIDHDPPCSLCSHDLCLFLFLCFIFQHDHMAQRSHYRIMIFYMTFGVLLYGRIFTLILFHFLHNSTTPILPVYVDQRRPHLEKDTTRPRGMIIWKIPTIPRRTFVTPD